MSESYATDSGSVKLAMPKISPPRGRIAKFFRSPYPPEVLHAAFGLAVTVLGAARSFYSDPAKDPHAGFLVAIIIVGALQFASSAFKIAMLWMTSDDRERDSIHSLTGCLHTLHALLLSTVKPNEDDPGLRLTVHIPCGKGSELVQVLNYVGDPRAKKRTEGRKFKVHCGIIGSAYRNGEALVASRQNDDPEAFVAELIKSWGYVETDARTVHPATRAWMAVPLKAGKAKDAEAVVYADATQRIFSSRRKGKI